MNSLKVPKIRYVIAMLFLITIVTSKAMHKIDDQEAADILCLLLGDQRNNDAEVPSQDNANSPEEIANGGSSAPALPKPKALRKKSNKRKWYTVVDFAGSESQTNRQDDTPQKKVRIVNRALIDRAQENDEVRCQWCGRRVFLCNYEEHINGYHQNIIPESRDLVIWDTRQANTILCGHCSQSIHKEKLEKHIRKYHDKQIEVLLDALAPEPELPPSIQS